MTLKSSRKTSTRQTNDDTERSNRPKRPKTATTNPTRASLRSESTRRQKLKDGFWKEVARERSPIPTRAAFDVGHRIAHMPRDLESVFAELGISQYLDSFVEQGFDTWETILDITESDL